MLISAMLTAMMVGFLGGVHCLGMCGPIAGALTFQLSAEIQVRPRRVAMMQVVYNLGRVSSYVILGLMAGAVGLMLVEAGDWLSIQRGLLAFSGLWMVILALWLKGWSALPSRLERVVGDVWTRVSGRYRPKMLPVRHVGQAYLFGLLWGTLPCGLVYSTLILAISAGSMLSGALVMLSFGVGTLPSVLLMGASAFWLVRIQRLMWVRNVAAMMMAMFGCWTLYLAIWGQAWSHLL